MKCFFSLALPAIILYGCVKPPSGNTVRHISCRVTAAYPFDSTLFIQGLVFYEQELYAGTGAPPHKPGLLSSIGRVQLPAGNFTLLSQLQKKYFGEGIAFFHNKLYQLTWKNQTGFIYDAADFRLVDSFFYRGQGWGLTAVKRFLVMSNGTDTLTFLNPHSMKPVKRLIVKQAGKPPGRLNELEYTGGSIYANVYGTHTIVKINPRSGEVTGLMNLDSLGAQIKKQSPGAEAMNGIAFNKKSGKMLVTGKFWPMIFELEFGK